METPVARDGPYLLIEVTVRGDEDGYAGGTSVRIIMQAQHASLNHKTFYILHHESSICLESFGEQIKLTNSILIMCPPPFWIKLFLFKIGVSFGAVGYTAVQVSYLLT